VPPLVTPAVQRWIDDARRDPDAFWDRAARELPWHRAWDKVFEWAPPETKSFRWFIGGQTNLCHNALDHHVASGRGDRVAMLYFNERGERASYTYAQLLDEVKRVAAALRGLGLRKGDRLTIYMPTSAEAIMLMLATVRIGAIHSVVFAGFGANALGDRIAASGSKAVFTADVTYRKGKDVALLPIVEDAIRSHGSGVEHLVVWRRGDGRPAGPHHDWRDFLARGNGQSSDVEWMESNEPAYMIATSGTTAKPKLAVHCHGGYQVYMSAMGRWCFGLSEDDVWWTTSDIGWIVGHAYMIHAPLVAGATTVVFEGALDHPAPDANWRVAVEEFGATGIFTSPTAVRLLMRYGDGPLAGIDHARLKRVVCAGEVLNAPAWDWLQNTILKGRAPVIDHMWQTEPAAPSSAIRTASSCCRSSPGRARFPCRASRARSSDPTAGRARRTRRAS